MTWHIDMREVGMNIEEAKANIGAEVVLLEDTKPYTHSNGKIFNKAVSKQLESIECLKIDFITRGNVVVNTLLIDPKHIALKEPKMQNYKIKVANEAESKEAQELLFELGYSWGEEGKILVDIEGNNFIANYLNTSHLFYSSTVYIDVEKNKQITLPQLRDLVVLHRNDSSYSTHEDQSGFQWLKVGDAYYQWNMPDDSNEPRWIEANPEGNTLLSRAETGMTWQDAFRALSEEKEVEGFSKKAWVNINELTVECIKNARAFRFAPPTVALEGNFTKEELLKIVGEMV